MKTRDLELLSAYLDGLLDPKESARLESRINSDRELESALSDLRVARGILRRLPKRATPRNFTLTRKMVGLNPPLPRSYAFFRFATAFASLLLVLTFAANVTVPRLSYIGPVNTGWGGGYGGGMGGGGGGPVMQQSAPQEMAAATEAPAAAGASVESEAPMAVMPAATNAPNATIMPDAEMLALPTATAPAAGDVARVAPTAEEPMEKSGGAEDSALANQPHVENPVLIPIGWQVTFLIIALMCAAVMFVLRQSAKQKWQ